MNGLIYRSNDGVDWELVKNTTETHIYSLESFNGYIYAGTGSNGLIYRNIPQLQIFYPQDDITTLIQYASIDNPAYHEYEGNNIFEKNLTTVILNDELECKSIIESPHKIISPLFKLVIVIILFTLLILVVILIRNIWRRL